MSADLEDPTVAAELRSSRAPRATSPITGLQIAVLALLALAGVGSVSIGVRRALVESQDLQWGGVWLLAHRIDPWREAIDGYPHHLANFSPPNYLHHLYLLLIPMSWISFPVAAALWCTLNLVLSVATMLLLRRLFSLTPFFTAALLFLLWMSSPFRVLLAAGQMTMVELFCFAIAFSALPVLPRGLAFGLSFAKYSFSPPTALCFLFCGRLRLLASAVAVPLLGLLVVSLFLTTPILHLATEPLALAGRAVMPGLADSMTLSEFVLRGHISHASAQHITYVVALLASAGYALLLSRFRLSSAAAFTLLSVASLFLFKHLVYDYVFLLVPLCFVVSPTGRRLRLPVGIAVLLFWFFAFLLNRSSTDRGVVHLPILFADNLLLATLFVVLTVGVLRGTSSQAGASIADSASTAV